MTSFNFDIPEKDLAGADHVLMTGRQLVAAFVLKCRGDNLTKAEIARRLEVDKAAVSRMLSGNANLTLRTVGELCWAMGLRPEVRLVDENKPAQSNAAPTIPLLSQGSPSMVTMGRQNMQVVVQ